MPFIKATKQQAKLRLALIGPAGSGKTYTALRIATALVPGGRIAFIDTERGSASKYADEFSFDVMELDSFHPQRYIDGIHEAEQAGYDVLIIDSLSHAWAGKEGALELVDKVAKRTSGNTFAAWREVTPLHNALVDTMIAARLHLIATMRSKTEWVVEKDERTGKTQPRKVGLAPVQRDGLEYEFDLVADLDADNTFIVSKSRCPALTGAVMPKAGPEVAETLRKWLSSGVAAPEPGRVVLLAPGSKGDPKAATLAYVREWAQAAGVDPGEAEQAAATFLRSRYKEVYDHLKVADWEKIYKAREKLIEQIAPSLTAPSGGEAQAEQA